MRPTSLTDLPAAIRLAGGLFLLLLGFYVAAQPPAHAESGAATGRPIARGVLVAPSPLFLFRVRGQAFAAP